MIQFLLLQVRLTQGLFLAGCSMTPKYNLLDHHEYLITRSVQQIQIKAKISIPIFSDATLGSDS